MRARDGAGPAGATRAARCSSSKCPLRVRACLPAPPPQGMDVVYKVEAEGSQSGTPKSKVTIGDSGELPPDSEPEPAADA